MRRRILTWSAVGGGVFVLIVFLASLVTFRPAAFRAKTERALSQHLNADVTIDQLDVRFFPRIHVAGSGFMLRVRNYPDLPPFIAMGRFSMDVSWFAAFTHYVDTVHVDGLRICIPPSEAREGLGAGEPSSELLEKVFNPSKVIVGHLITHAGELSFAAKKRAKGQPLIFPIHELRLDELGFDRSIPFHAVLTNPLPTGLVDASGSFGPWQKLDPSSTHVAGSYEFSDADLSTIDGIGGTLTSKGHFEGALDQINVAGTTDTPDFSLEMAGNPVHLEATFRSTVDGTDGTTVLHEVNAKFLNTSVLARGAITNLPGPGRHDVELAADVKQGRIEDLLRLALKAKRTPVTGNVTLRSKLRIPPGNGPAPKRLQFDGRFGLAGAKFRDPQVDAKLKEFSRRTSGKNKDEPQPPVVTDLEGDIKLANGVIDVRQMSFRVPGALVQLAGTCEVDSRALHLQGTLTMDASVSKAVGGFKSVFLKLFDPLFRRNGPRSRVPIKIEGTIDEPKFGIVMGKIFR